MLNVAIVDDEESERKRISDCLEYVAQKKKVEFAVREFSSADRFLIGYESGYDIIFMDIDFSVGSSGMDAARQLRKIDKNVIIIFVTNMAQMAVQGYEVDALDFIVKPFDKYTFSLKMTRALGRITVRRNDEIIITVNGDLVSIRTHLIKYLEVQGHYIVYHSKEGEFVEYSSLSAAEKKIRDDAFIRCNRGCMVNLRFVTSVKKDSCIVDGKEIFIARPQQKKLKQAFADWLGGSKGNFRGGE